MVGWFDVVCIQRKHEDTKLIKSHGSYQQASMRCCLFGEDQELSYEGLPWSTMVYHRFLDVLPPPKGEAIVGSARTGGAQDDFRASIDHFRPGTQSRLREIPMGYLWDIYGYEK